MSRLLGVLGALLIAAGLVLFGIQQYRRAPAPAGAPALDKAELSAGLPTDPAVTSGTYPNGLRYYVRANPEPKNRAELRLVVNAGSILEDDDQRGVAHFVEHMAFNGTAHFPKQAIGEFLESIGMRFGPSINAVTTFDETNYALQVPMDRPDVLDRALLIMEDWAHAVTFDPAEVDKERGVIVEEWRQRQGAGTRLANLQFPVLLQGSRYADRVPIGTPESIKAVSVDRIKQFYADWYRPDLMAVIAVGDFQAPAVEQAIRRHFSSIPKPASPRPRPVYDVPDVPGTRFAIATDPEATSTSITIRTRTRASEMATVGGYRSLLVDRLATATLSARLAEIATQAGSPFLAANAIRGPFVRVADAVTLNAAVRENGLERGLLALATESARLTQFGITQGELDRQKTLTLRGLERVMAEKQTRPSSQLAAEYSRNFLVAEPYPGLEAEAELTRRFLPGITLGEVDGAIKAWIGAPDRVVAITAPQKAGVPRPDPQRLAAVLRTAGAAPLTPYAFKPGADVLLETTPAGGSVVSTTAKDQGVTEIMLSNGVKVVLKPTTYKEDEVIFSAISRGGTSLAMDADLIPAVSAAQVVNTMGYGRFSSAALQRALTGKVAAVRPVIGLYETALSGGSSAKDLETLFELIYLVFTEPRRDPVIFKAFQSSIREAAANASASPELAFRQAIAAALAQGHPRATVSLENAVEQMDMDRSLAFYKARMADASGFTFTFVGSFNPDTLTPLAAKYLGALPADRHQETWRDVGIRAPTSVVEKTVRKGTEPAARTAIVFTGPLASSRQSAVPLTFMANVLQTRLRNTLREELSGTYNVGVGTRALTVPHNEYAVSIEFGADPARLDGLVSRVFGEIARFKNDGPTPQEVADVQAALLRDLETQSRQNAWVLSQLSQIYQFNESTSILAEAPARVRAVTSTNVRDIARTTLDTARYVRVTLLPENRTGR